MAHNESAHFEKLQKLCRTCGHLAICREYSKKHYQAYSCFDNGINILTVFGINVDKDSQNVHPQLMCHKCYKKMKKMLAVNNLNSITKARENHRAPIWMPFNPAADPAKCNVCTSELGYCKISPK